MCLASNLHKLCSRVLFGSRRGGNSPLPGLLLYGLIESILSNYLDRLNGVSYKELADANSSGQVSLAEHAKLLRAAAAMHKEKAPQ
jgi:hypothetical protein